MKFSAILIDFLNFAWTYGACFFKFSITTCITFRFYVQRFSFRVVISTRSGRAAQVAVFLVDFYEQRIDEAERAVGLAAFKLGRGPRFDPWMDLRRRNC